MGTPGANCGAETNNTSLVDYVVQGLHLRKLLKYESRG